MNDPSSVRCSHGVAPPFVILIHGDVCRQFCVYPCDDPYAQAIANGFPPNRTTPVPNPNAPIFSNANVELARRGAPSHAGDNLLNPPYAINNTAGVLSDLTVYVGLSLLTYDMRLVDEWLNFTARQIQFTQMGSLSMTHVSLNALLTP